MFQRLCGTGLILAIVFSLTAFSSVAQERRTSPPHQAPVPDTTAPRTEEMVDVGGRKLHCRVYGERGPTVVLVSGFGAPQSYWDTVLPEIAAQTTVVTFDRAGVGKSEIGDLPTHGLQSAKDLRSLLGQLKVPTPYVLVGHSYGGNVVRLFASSYPDSVGGIILEDSQHEDALEEQRKILEGEDLDQFEQLAARFGTPDDPKTELDYINITKEQVRESKPLPEVPFVVLTAGDRNAGMPPMFSEAARKNLGELGLSLQKRLVALVPGGKQIVVEGVGHNMHVEKPDALINPLVQMIKEIRK